MYPQVVAHQLPANDSVERPATTADTHRPAHTVPRRARCGHDAPRSASNVLLDGSTGHEKANDRPADNADSQYWNVRLCHDRVRKADEETDQSSFHEASDGKRDQRNQESNREAAREPGDQIRALIRKGLRQNERDG